jgi:hypothetical protein
LYHTEELVSIEEGSHESKKVLSLLVAVAVLSCITKAQIHKIEPEIFIPEGFPITLDVSLDEKEYDRTKYNIQE